MTTCSSCSGGTADSSSSRVASPRIVDEHAPTAVRLAADHVTDWSQIVALYDQLLAVAPTPVVALSRAIAVGEVQGAAAALALVEELDLNNYHPFHVTRADPLRRRGRNSEAAAAYGRAAALAPTDAERNLLRLGGRASR